MDWHYDLQNVVVLLLLLSVVSIHLGPEFMCLITNHTIVLHVKVITQSVVVCFMVELSSFRDNNINVADDVSHVSSLNFHL